MFRRWQSISLFSIRPNIVVDVEETTFSSKHLASSSTRRKQSSLLLPSSPNTSVSSRKLQGDDSLMNKGKKENVALKKFVQSNASSAGFAKRHLAEPKTGRR